MVRRGLCTGRRRGQSMVEFVLVLPVFLTLIFGAICVLQILLVQDTVAQAARASAHQAALIGGGDGASGSLATASGRVADAARSVIDGAMATDATKATISVVCRDQAGAVVSQCRRYYPITVTIQYADSPWVIIPGLFSSVEARVSATRVAEQDLQ